MTLFFGGEVLCQLPDHELKDWYEKVQYCLGEAGFHNDLISSSSSPLPTGEDTFNATSRNENDDDDKNKLGQKTDASTDALSTTTTTTTTGRRSDDDDDDFWFHVTSISMFPPKRNNLVVAILEASPAWHMLHHNIRNIAKNGNSQGLKDITAYSPDTWIAHVTLGNIVGGEGSTKSQIRTAFDEVLGQITISDGLLAGQRDNDAGDSTSDIGGQLIKAKRLQSTERDFLFAARTQGIAMGGPVPDQVPLDWDFTYRPRHDSVQER